MIEEGLNKKLFDIRNYIKREGPCRNRGRLPKLTAYEKIEILMLFFV